MAKITKVEIQKNNKQKVNLYIDNEYYNKLYLDTCVKYSLKAGIEIDLQELDKIIEESDKNLALNSTVKYISSALKTRKQVKDYLKKKEFGEEVVEYVLDKLEEYKYIDDESYIIAYVNTYKNKFGTNKLKLNLRQKGIKESYIDNYFEEINDENIEDEVCYNLAKKKAKNMDLSDIKNKQKLNRYLISRGFDFDLVNQIIKKLILEQS